jgi:allantoinase
MIVRGRRVVLPGGVRPAAIRIEGGRIAAIEPYTAPRGDDDHDAGELVVLPGVVDTHVHVNEPGRADWEGWTSATRAAAAGGVTTLVDMPLNAVPATTTRAALDAKIASAGGRIAVDVGLWGGVIPGNEGELEPLWRDGVRGFKCFMAPSGVDEFPHVVASDLERALPILARLGAPLLVHAEDPATLARAAADAGGAADTYAAYLRSRPPAAEVEAIRTVLGLARAHRARIHIVHLAAAEALPLLREARAAGVNVTVETCPHYLRFGAEEIPDDGTAWKCAPPIRDAANRERLWEALEAGEIGLVASDHSPSPPEMRRGDWGSAWGGIASLQLSLPALWTMARARGIPIERLAEWMSAAPSRLAGLERRKGAIEAGRDADLVVFDPDATWTVRAAALHHRHPLTPWDGEAFAGAVRRTYVRGNTVFDDGRFPAAAPVGTLLLRSTP